MQHEIHLQSYSKLVFLDGELKVAEVQPFASGPQLWNNLVEEVRLCFLSFALLQIIILFYVTYYLCIVPAFILHYAVFFYFLLWNYFYFALSFAHVFVEHFITMCFCVCFKSCTYCSYFVENFILNVAVEAECTGFSKGYFNLQKSHNYYLWQLEFNPQMPTIYWCNTISSEFYIDWIKMD